MYLRVTPSQGNLTQTLRHTEAPRHPQSEGQVSGVQARQALRRCRGGLHGRGLVRHERVRTKQVHHHRCDVQHLCAHRQRKRVAADGVRKECNHGHLPPVPHHGVDVHEEQTLVCAQHLQRLPFEQRQVLRGKVQQVEHPVQLGQNLLHRACPLHRHAHMPLGQLPVRPGHASERTEVPEHRPHPQRPVRRRHADPLVEHWEQRPTAELHHLHVRVPVGDQRNVRERRVHHGGREQRLQAAAGLLPGPPPAMRPRSRPLLQLLRLPPLPPRRQEVRVVPRRKQALGPLRVLVREEAVAAPQLVLGLRPHRRPLQWLQQRTLQRAACEAHQRPTRVLWALRRVRRRGLRRPVATLALALRLVSEAEGLERACCVRRAVHGVPVGPRLREERVAQRPLVFAGLVRRRRQHRLQRRERRDARCPHTPHASRLAPLPLVSQAAPGRRRPLLGGGGGGGIPALYGVRRRGGGVGVGVGFARWRWWRRRRRRRRRQLQTWLSAGFQLLSDTSLLAVAPSP
eukprot:Rhum_TRINITY_DN19044_c0_g2::Rhum_TRINITY_DN19044_c0_g2_i1::g.169071::m.169071